MNFFPVTKKTIKEPFLPSARGRKKRAGFTLIESLVAISILVGAVVGPLTLISRSIFSVRDAKDKLIAANLAQEGIEIIRGFRDSNVLRGCQNAGVSDWRALVDSSAGCTRLTGGGSPGSDWEIDVVSTSLSALSGTPRNLLLCQAGTNTGLYAYSCPGDSSPIGTRFSRKITLITPPDEIITTVSPSVTIPSADIMQVSAVVYWTNIGGAPQTHTQKDILYNWR